MTIAGYCKQKGFTKVCYIAETISGKKILKKEN